MIRVLTVVDDEAPARARLAQALDRVRVLAAGGSEPGLDQAIRGSAGAPSRFLVKNAGHYLVVGEGRVIYFSSEDGLTPMVAEGGQYWMDPTLNELEARLDPALKNGQRLEVSRRRFRELLQALEGA
jgi:DNA-binding LytR/AlgR family response regulator